MMWTKFIGLGHNEMIGCFIEGRESFEYLTDR